MKQMNPGMGMGTGIMIAAVAGAAVGAGVALLFAPCSGADARRWVSRRSRDLADRATTAVTAAADDLASSMPGPMRRSPGSPTLS